MEHLDVQNGIVGSLSNSLNLLQQAVFEKAFQGDLVPRDPNDEPASVLLERIRKEKKAREEAEKAQRKQNGPKGGKMKKTPKKRKDILEVLRDKAESVKPEELFSEAGFTEDSIDEFYEQLRDAVASEQAREVRKGDDVFLEARKT